MLFFKPFYSLSRLGLLLVKDLQLFNVVRRIRQQRLTYLGYGALSDLLDEVSLIEQQNRPGIFLEAGSALGGSAIAIASAKRDSRPLYLYDSFEMIPPPSPMDGSKAQSHYNQIKGGLMEGIGGDRYYGYRKDLLDVVAENFRKFDLDLTTQNIHIVQGSFEESLMPTLPIAFAHIDCDWYQSVKVCLQRIVPALTDEGVLVIDDYFAWQGCRKAVDEYFADKMSDFQFSMKARLHIAHRRR